MQDWQRPSEPYMRAEMRAAGFFLHFDEGMTKFEHISEALVKIKLYHRGHPNGTIYIEGSVPYEVFYTRGLSLVLLALLSELNRIKATQPPPPPPPKREHRRDEKPPEIIQKRTPNRGGRQAKIDALRRIAKDQAGKPEGENAARLLAKLEGKPAEEPQPASDPGAGFYGPGFYRPSGGPPNWYSRAQDLELEKFLERLRNMADTFSNMGDSFGHSAGLGKIMRDELERLEREAKEMQKENRSGQKHED